MSTTMGNSSLKPPNTTNNSNNNNVATNGSNNMNNGLDNGNNNNQRHRGRKMHNVNMPSGVKTSIVVPSKWPCNCARVGGKLKLYTLRREGKMSGREFKIVEDEMHKTLQYHEFKSYSIKLIQKVENCCLWTKFRQREQQIVKEWKAQRVNERMLFHGSPHADDIVKTGFDINRANFGLFGKGIYFAPHSAKSNGYAGYLGHKKMLLCRVALGNMCKLTSTNSGLTAPPSGCHSVEGKWSQYPEYIIYNSDQAYPEYLVHYNIVY